MSETTHSSKERARLTDKTEQPSLDQIRLFLGEDSWERLQRFEEMLRERYMLNRQIKFPFGNEYGWGFRYCHGKTLLLYLFFEQGSFSCTISINDAGAEKVEEMLHRMRPETRTIWENRYPCGTRGGWIHSPITTDEDLPDLIKLVEVKNRPKKTTRSAN